jgi:predicted  nucleic acid-binding Zn-ribbon protein
LLKSTLNEIDAQIKDLQSTINTITTTDALNKAKEDADKMETQLSNVSAADIEKQMLSVQDNLGKLSLDDIVKDLAALEIEVEEVVTAINQLIINKSEVVARYDMKGNPVDSTYKGVQIIKLKNGKTIKLYVK